MTSIGEVAQAIGLADNGSSRAVLMAMVDDRPRHAYLADALTVDVDGFDALYHASGLFRDGSIVDNAGRSLANVERVVWLPFDADLLDFLGCPPSSDPAHKEHRAALLAELGSMPQPDLDGLVAGLRADLEETFARIGAPMHRIDYTGYGLCAYIYLPAEDQTRVDDARAAHKHLVAEINKAYTDRLVDPACSDAGTRVTRMPGSVNHKGVIPRTVVSLVPYTGETQPLGMRPGAARPVARMIPTDGSGLTPQDAEALIAAIAPSWTDGQRHAMGLAVAGMLAKAGIPETQALAVIEALSAGDRKPWDRAASVRSTYNRARQGGTVAGYTSLRSLIPAPALSYVDEMLERYRGSARSGPVSIGVFDVVGSQERTAPDDPTALLPTELPEIARRGWLGRYIDLVEPTTEAPDSFHLACGLTLLGACIGRRVALYHASDRLYPNFYTLLIGPSGRARKDTAIRRSLSLPQLPPPAGSPLHMLSAPFRVVRDISSAEGLIRVLSKDKNIYFYATEFSKLMQNATRESTSSIQPTLMEAFDTPTVITNTVKREENSLTARDPFLSVMAAVQPEILSSLIGNQQQYSGFLNRWLLVVGDGKGPRPTPPNLDEAAAWTLMREASDAIGSFPEGSVVSFDAEADERWTSWYVGAYPAGNASSQEDAMGIRLGTLIKKAALIHAVVNRSRVVTVNHLDSAIALVDWSWHHTRKLLPTWGESPEAQLQRKIIEVLARRGPILHKRKVQQYAGNRAGPGVFSRVVKAMIENGEIVSTPDNMISIAPEGIAS